MLILSRKYNEGFIIDGRIVVKVVRLDRDMVKIGIDAPMDVPVHRQEIFDEIQRNNREAVMATRPPVPRLNSALFSSPIPVAAPAELAPVPAHADEPGFQKTDVEATPKSKVTPAATATPKPKTRRKIRASRAS